MAWIKTSNMYSGIQVIDSIGGEQKEARIISIGIMKELKYKTREADHQGTTFSDCGRQIIDYFLSNNSHDLF